jgi:hypothetical protein
MTSKESEKLHKLSVWACSYSRAEVLLENCPLVFQGGGRVSGTEWFKVLGEWWVSCDNIGAYRTIFRSILRKASQAQLQAMMNDEERAKWKQLPDKIQAWRGCEANDRTGLSFSLSQETARRFPFLRRYLAELPSLITATIPRKSAVLKLERGEEEVITAFAAITQQEYLNEQPTQ